MTEESPEEKLGLLNEAENEVIRKNRPFRIFALFLAFEPFHVLMWLVSKLPVSDSDSDSDSLSLSISLFWIAEVKFLVLFSHAHRL